MLMTGDSRHKGAAPGPLPCCSLTAHRPLGLLPPGALWGPASTMPSHLSGTALPRSVPSRGHLVTSGDIFSCHNPRWGCQSRGRDSPTMKNYQASQEYLWGILKYSRKTLDNQSGAGTAPWSVFPVIIRNFCRTQCSEHSRLSPPLNKHLHF